MARTLIAGPDDFSGYANGSDLGNAADWLELNGSTGLIRVYKPASDGFAYEHFQSRSECRWDGSGTFANDQYAKATLARLFINGTDTNYIGVACRMSADTLTGRDYYAVQVFDGLNAAATKTAVVKYVNNTLTTIYTAATGDDWTNGDTVELEAVDNGANVDLKVYKNGVLLRTVQDTSSVLASGKPGIVGQGSLADFGPAITDWEGGDVTGSSTQAPRSQQQFKLRRV